MTPLPRVFVAAAASGQGKTTVTVGIMAALAGRGLTVAPAKVGPDYIDPGYHALATGRPGRNLDPWMQGDDLVAPLLVHSATTPTPADVAVVEGVMGMFDGRLGTDGHSSSAHVARLTNTPVVVVLDISSASRTAAATLRGLATHDPHLRVAGVILNKAGTERHADEVTRAVGELGIPVLGVLPRDAGVSAPSRHLGLVPADERPEARAALERLADHVERLVDLDTLVAIARTAPDLDVPAWSPPVRPAGGARPVVAVAGGRAFTFRYAETDETLRALGLEPVTFDPARDEALPAGTQGLYLGGGFPEVHARTLTHNTRMLAAVREAVLDGLPTVAECAGMLYLARTLDGHGFAGVLPADAGMHPRLTLGYRTATAPVDTLLAEAGASVHGHEFHRTRTTPAAGTAPAWSLDGRDDGFSLDPAGTGSPTVHASYLHTHWAGAPMLAERFAEAVHAAAPVADGPVARAARALHAVRATPASPDESGSHTADGHEATGHEITEHEVTDLLGGTDVHGVTDLHGDDELRDDLVDLAVNVRLAEPPAWLAEVVRGSVSRLAAYPVIDQARSALARLHGVPEAMVLPTSGAAEAFTLVARGVPAQRPLVVHPQFSEPDAAFARAGRAVEHHVLDVRADTGLDPERIPAEVDLVVVGNPTNPTGRLHPRDTLQRLRRPGRVLVVDEAFMDAVPGEPESVIAADLTGVLVIRSLTKTWGLAGLRAGYVVGDPRLVAALARQQPHWSVSTPAAAVMAAVTSPAAVAESTRMAHEGVAWRGHLERGLRRLGLEPVPSHAPFVLVEAPAGTREALRDNGYAVRRGDTFPGLGPTWVRIAVRDPLTTDGFLRALSGVLRHLEVSA